MIQEKRKKFGGGGFFCWILLILREEGEEEKKEKIFLILVKTKNKKRGGRVCKENFLLNQTTNIQQCFRFVVYELFNDETESLLGDLNEQK